jgi:predicted Zn-dependent protease
MRAGCKLLMFCALAVVSGGCATPSAGLRSDAAREGLSDRSRHSRLDAALAHVCPRSGLPTLKIHLMDSAEPAAFSWPNGSVSVSGGLIDLVSDDELSAVLAHELGHLLKPSPAARFVKPTVSSLRGCAASLEVERQADNIGVTLLTNAHIPSNAMATMLEKVRATTHQSASCKSDLSRRVELLKNLPDPHD